MRIKKRTIYYSIAALIILIAAIAFYLNTRPDHYYTDDNGKLHAAEHTDLQATRALFSQDENVTIYKTSYKSQDWAIIGFLYVPKNANGKGMLLLPGGGVTKEGEDRAARAFAKRGFIVLTIDQRGVGETDGPYDSIDQDFTLFENHVPPTVHLLILDALAGIQYLQEQPEVRGKVLLSGESMGGRAAMVAARISHNINGLLIISSAGFNDPPLPIEQKRFLNSFDPDINIQDVKVPIVFIHSTNDTTIPIAAAQATYARAPEPKKFYTIDHCPHGYCAAMEEDITQGLEFIEKN